MDQLKSISDAFIKDLQQNFDLRFHSDELKYAILKINKNICISKNFKYSTGNDRIENFINKKLLSMGTNLLKEADHSKSIKNMFMIKQVFRLVLLDIYDNLVNQENNRLSEVMKQDKFRSILNKGQVKQVNSNLEKYNSIIYV